MILKIVVEAVKKAVEQVGSAREETGSNGFRARLERDSSSGPLKVQFSVVVFQDAAAPTYSTPDNGRRIVFAVRCLALDC